MMLEEFVWTERYRPRTIDDVILPDDVKERFKAFLADGNVPALLISGSAGTGKTTVCRALLEQLSCDYIIINGSKDNGIDMLRGTVESFARTVSMLGTRKYIIIDEADGLTPNAQNALRNSIELYSKNCGFILTCNFPSKISEPIRSRFAQIEFKIPKTIAQKMQTAFFKRCCQILAAENVEFDKAVVAELIKKYYPDWRRVLNELQNYSASGRIDSGILSSLNETTMQDLMGFLKERKFTEIRKWAATNMDGDANYIFRNLYDNASTYITKDTVPMLVLILGKYQFQDGQVADRELNLVACLTEVMVECSFL